MPEEEGKSKVWAEIGAFKEGRLQWIEMVVVKKESEERLEDLVARRLEQLKIAGRDLRTRTCQFENERNHFGDWKEA